MVRGVGSSVEDPALNWGGAWLWVPVLGFLSYALHKSGCFGIALFILRVRFCVFLAVLRSS